MNKQGHSSLDFFHIKELALCRVVPKGMRAFSKVPGMASTATRWRENSLIASTKDLGEWLASLGLIDLEFQDLERKIMFY